MGVAATFGMVALFSVLSMGRSPTSTTDQPSAAPTESVRPTLPRSLADLRIGDRPGLGFVRAGRTVVFPDRSVELDWEVATVGRGRTEVLVFDEVPGAIHRVGPDGIQLLSDDATSHPVYTGAIAWIENGSEIVHHSVGSQRQPLPDGCCEDARVVGYDVDMDVDIFVSADGGAWMWDTYEGREGNPDPPPDSEDYFWPVGGLGSGTLVGTGSGSEVLVAYPNDEWGWGFVAGPRDPSSDAPVPYQEQERVTAARVWLTLDAVVALEPTGRLVILGSEHATDHYGHHWRQSTGERHPLALPTDLQVHGVINESRHTVLIDAIDNSQQRAWVRCNTHTHTCEIATELDPRDITPE